MSADVTAEIWGELRRYVNVVDRDEAAETVVAVLIDNDYDADQIRAAFKGDAEIKRALALYVNKDVEEAPEDDYEEESDIDEDERWEN
jgi:hypothetical protein